MNNVKRIIGNPSKPVKTIGDMIAGESGYTVTWAWDNVNGLDTTFSIGEKGGTSSLWVECIVPGEYVIEFEEPEYKTMRLK